MQGEICSLEGLPMSRNELVQWALAMGPDAMMIAKKAVEAIVSGQNTREVLTRAERDTLAMGLDRTLDLALGLSPEESSNAAG
jgi:hypothetical protein